MCNFDDIRALEIDHVQGDGWRDRKYYSGNSYYKLILNDLWTGRYRLLCANCHRIRHAAGHSTFDLDDVSDGEYMELTEYESEADDET